MPTPASARQLPFEDVGTPLVDVTFVVLDLETTGLSPERHAITEIGAVKVRGGEVQGELATFVDPREPIPGAITAITGITDAMVRDAPPIDVVLPTVLDFLGDAVLVAHNAPFDLAFLRAAAARLYAEPVTPPVVDTARLARRLLAGEVRSFRLSTLAAHLRARTAPNHRALTDARATVDVLHALIGRAGAYGATTLPELQELTRSRSDRAFRRRGLVDGAPSAPGVYRFVGHDGEVLYVGKAQRLDRRLRSYFGQDPRRRVADLVREVHEVTWVTTPTALEAEVRELREIHHHRPRYNRRSTRPERTVHLCLTQEAAPRLSIVTRPPDDAWSIGPFTGRRTAAVVAEALAEATGLRTCTTRLRRRQDHPACVLKEIGRCAAPCDGTQSLADHARLTHDVRHLAEDPTAMLAEIRERMSRAAGDDRFERAREHRARLHAVARALQAAQRHATLRAVTRLVVRRPGADGDEVAVIRYGRLVATTVLPGDADESAAADGATVIDTDDEGAATPSFEEVRLLLRWLDADGVRIVAADGTVASRIAGGAALAATVAEARAVTRRVQRDRQTLDGEKVRRRRAPDTTEPAPLGR
jgi:DNA polymerase III subunit epsilon